MRPKTSRSRASFAPGVGHGRGGHPPGQAWIRKSSWKTDWKARTQCEACETLRVNRINRIIQPPKTRFPQNPTRLRLSIQFLFFFWGGIAPAIFMRLPGALAQSMLGGISCVWWVFWTVSEGGSAGKSENASRVTRV